MVNVKRYLVLDYGCLECGEDTMVIDVTHDIVDALNKASLHQKTQALDRLLTRAKQNVLTNGEKRELIYLLGHKQLKDIPAFKPKLRLVRKVYDIYT